MKKKTLATVISMITILFIFSSISYSATPAEWVNAHNKYRRMHLDTPPVTWDNALAQKALNCANIPKGQKPLPGGNHCNYGENWSSSTGSAESIVSGWYSEEASYTTYVGYGNEPKTAIKNGMTVLDDPNFPKYGHFTQVVWKNTKKIGCATGNYGTVCNYEPYGNYANQFAANVKIKMPQVDIKVNGLDHVSVSSNTPVSIAFSLDTHGWAGVYSDWWFIIGAPWGFYSFELGKGWVPGFSPLIQHSLFDISPPFKIFNDILPLPKGTYLVVIGVDKADGILNSFLCYDYAWITIK